MRTSRLIAIWLIGMISHPALADPRPDTALGLLGRSLDPVGIRSNSALRAFASGFVQQATQSAFNSPSALNQLGAIDSTMEEAGPIFLSHPDTLGQGKTDVSLLAQTQLIDPDLEGPGLLLIANNVDQFAAKIDYQLKLRMSDIALALSYGLTDDLDVSLLFLFVHSELKINVGRQIVRRNGQPFPSPKVTSTETITNTGFGDTTLRLKYKLPDLGPFEMALGLESQAPTGEFTNMLGTGDWWLTPTFSAHTSWGRADATLNMGLDFDISDATRSQALYGVGASYMLIPKRLIGVAEFLGRSDLDEQRDIRATDALYVLPNGTIQARPLFGFDVGRKDYFDLSFSLRFVLTPGIMGFVSGTYEINDVGLHGGKIIPTIGIGGYF